MRIFIAHLSRVKYRTRRPPPPQRRITRIPTRPAANSGSGNDTPDLINYFFWKKRGKWLNCKRKKGGVKKCLEIMTIKGGAGGGVRRLMEKN